MSQPNGTLVIGAGELGLAVIRALQAHPWPADREGQGRSDVSVLMRQATVESKDQPKLQLLQILKTLGTAIVAGDYAADSEEVLSSVFGRFHTVVAASGFTYGAAGLQVKITRAVLAAGVAQYVPWQFGVDYDVLGAGSSQDSFDEQLQVRALLRAQAATDWRIISVGVFMSFLFEPWWGVVDEQGKTVRALGGWNTSITTTAPEDIGNCTADVLASWKDDQDNEASTEKIIFVAGETLTYGQLAESVERGLGSPMKRELWDMPHLLHELENDPTNGLKKYRPIFAGDKGIAWDYEKSWNAKRGIKTVTTEEYASRRRGAH